MVTRYCLKTPIPALLDKPGGEHSAVTLPADGVLEQSFKPSTFLGMVGVYWEGRHYSIYPKDLIRKGERVSTA